MLCFIYIPRALKFRLLRRQVGAQASILHALLVLRKKAAQRKKAALLYCARRRPHNRCDNAPCYYGVAHATWQPRHGNAWMMAYKEKARSVHADRGGNSHEACSPCSPWSPATSHTPAVSAPAASAPAPAPHAAHAAQQRAMRRQCHASAPAPAPQPASHPSSTASRCMSSAQV